MPVAGRRERRSGPLRPQANERAPLVGVHDANGILKRKKPPEGGFCFRTEEQVIGDGE